MSKKCPAGYGLNCIDCFAMIWNVHWNKRTEWYGTVWYNERVCMLLHTQYQIKSISQNYSYNSKCPQNLSKLHFIDILFIWLRLSGSFCWTKQKKTFNCNFAPRNVTKSRIRVFQPSYTILWQNRLTKFLYAQQSKANEYKNVRTYNSIQRQDRV